MYIYKCIYIYIVLYCELNYRDQKIRRTLTHDVRKHWTDVSILIGLISSVLRDLHNWRSKPATTDCRVETLQLSPQSISHTSDTKLRSHCNYVAN